MAYGSHSSVEIARSVIAQQADAIRRLEETIGKSFSDAVDLILDVTGYVVVTGVGKSGRIGQKIAASLSSTGTPALFLHPTEASHGDLGAIRPGSIVLAVSYSGESRELVDILRYSKASAIPVIGLSSSKESLLGKNSDILLQLPYLDEACPNGLAPTTSTTMTLVMGDALTIALMERRGFTRDEFGVRHPGGKIGKSLHTVGDFLSGRAEPLPLISGTAGFADVIQSIAAGCQGCVGVVDETGSYIGIITDGDLRRSMAPGCSTASAGDIMTDGGTIFTRDDKIVDVIAEMARKRISNGFVLEDGRPIGLVHTKTLLAEGYI